MQVPAPIEVPSLLHFDPVQILVTIVTIIIVYSKMKATIEAHSEALSKLSAMVAKHEQECVEYKRITASATQAMEIAVTKITVMLDNQQKAVENLQTFKEGLMMPQPRMRPRRKA